MAKDNDDPTPIAERVATWVKRYRTRRSFHTTEVKHVLVREAGASSHVLDRVPASDEITDTDVGYAVEETLLSYATIDEDNRSFALYLAGMEPDADGIEKDVILVGPLRVKVTAEHRRVASIATRTPEAISSTSSERVATFHSVAWAQLTREQSAHSAMLHAQLLKAHDDVRSLARVQVELLQALAKPMQEIHNVASAAISAANARAEEASKRESEARAQLAKAEAMLERAVEAVESSNDRADKAERIWRNVGNIVANVAEKNGWVDAPAPRAPINGTSQ